MIDQSPEPSAVAVPTEPSWSEVNSTLVPISAVAARVAVVSLVMSSVSSVPESLAGSRFGAAGAAGAVVSTVTDRAVEELLWFPAVSVAVVVRLWVPSPSVLAVMGQLPVVPSAVAVPTVPSIEEDSVTVLPASAVPVTVGVASLVRLSSSAVPESLAAERSGTPGAAGAVAVSYTHLTLPTIYSV